jgi:predicted nucleic acid-binding protein
MIILDTNVISEMMRPVPASQVERWYAANPASLLFTTALSKAEILYGVALLPAGKRRNSLHAAAQAMFDEDFADRILPFDSDAALVYPELAAARRKAGKPISQIDAQIASIARSRGSVVATRNGDDFSDCGLTIVDPWIAS